jgi:molybdenum cofactor cytidylyltransferase
MNSDLLSPDVAFNLGQVAELVAIVGGGGKTNLMFALAQTLGKGSVITTTTRIFAAQMKLAPAVCQLDIKSEREEHGVMLRPLSQLNDLLAQHGHCLIVGQVTGEKASGVPPDFPARLLAKPAVQSVIVEADGSRMRPCKVPAAHEPVIPDETSIVIPVAGIDAVGGRLDEVAHRPELASALTGLKLTDDSARVVVCLNKVESQSELVIARKVAKIVLNEKRIQQVVIGAVRSQQPVREVQRRVTAVVLSAGESHRMGRTKQLLPWGDNSVLGQVLKNLQSSMVSDVVVITGHDGASVSAVASEHGVKTIANPDYASGEMLSSLKVAVRQLADSQSAILVVLADQPMVETETINRLLVTYWQRKAGIIAPTYRGQRGNPVLIDRQFWEELLKLPAGKPPRTLLKRHEDLVTLLEVNTPTVVQDIDTPEQYRRFRPT